MVIRKLTLVGIVLSLASFIGLGGNLLPNDVEAQTAQATKIRWDIVNLNLGPTPWISGGGVSWATTAGPASAPAASDLRITLTGAGTFRPGSSDARDVTGGGSWQTRGASGAATGSGTYRVTGVLDWQLLPGTFNPVNADAIGLSADARAGLATLRVSYSDGQDGILVLSCMIVGTPPGVFEGITATKGAVNYSVPGPLLATVNENRTLFHEVAADASRVAPATVEVQLTGAEEVPAVASTVSAFARLSLSETKELSYTLTVSGISPEQITGAHIHPGARGINGPVLYPLTSGPFTQVSGSITLRDSDVATLRSGNFYINVQTLANPGGAARAQIVLAASPASPASPAAVQAISPPRTGDGGLVREARGLWAPAALLTASILLAAAVAAAKRRA